MSAETCKTIVLIGALDTKGEEYAFVKELIENRGHKVLTVNFGVLGSSTHMKPDIEAEDIAQAGNETLQSLRSKNDRGHAMAVMSRGAAVLIRRLFDDRQFDGVLGMGGTGSTSVISAAMRNLPVGVPKVLVSTIACGDTKPIVGTRDIVLLPSVVDVAGLNRISLQIFSEAAGAIVGMVETKVEPSSDQKPLITVSMFGNTTPCVDRCREILTGKGYEVLVFHCTGTGGKTMEDLVEDKLITAVLDITTTEWADELYGGAFAAGRNRLEAPGKVGIPHIIVPGCVDMVTYGPRETVPEKYNDRHLYIWNAFVTCMRTNPEENREMGRIFAEKANNARGPVAFLVPLKGFSILDSEGNEFWWPEADRAFLETIKDNVRADIPVEEVDCNINDPKFAERAVDMLLKLLERRD